MMDPQLLLHISVNIQHLETRWKEMIMQLYKSSAHL